MSSPSPSPPLLRGNDYAVLKTRLGEAPAVAPISIVIPTYNRADRLARTLAAILHLERPTGGLEIVVADDGSTDDTPAVVRAFEASLSITHVRQADYGHRLAEVCNLGIRAARHQRIVLLQSDMLPSRGLLSAYGRWLDLETPLLLIGMRRFIRADHLGTEAIKQNPSFETDLIEIQTQNEMWTSDGEGVTEDWRMPLYRQSDWLRNEPAPFRAVVGSNLAFRRKDALAIGGFCEEFQSWGGEDGEFGYRAFLAGFALVPVVEAIAYHQEPPDGRNETDRRAGFAVSRTLRTELCALAPFRRPDDDTERRTPMVVVGRKGQRWTELERRSPYWLILDDDALVSSCAIRTLVEVLEREPVDGVVLEGTSRGLFVSTRAWHRAVEDKEWLGQGLAEWLLQLDPHLRLKRLDIASLDVELAHAR